MSGKITVYTDGACSGNPGAGGWGAILLADGGHRREIHGGEALTTNNRMELCAVINALLIIKQIPSDVEITTDSTYVKDGITTWIKSWKQNGWRTSARKAVKNADLWRRLDELVAAHNITWHWIKGHSGHPQNERADELARMGVEENKAPS